MITVAEARSTAAARLRSKTVQWASTPPHASNFGVEAATETVAGNRTDDASDALLSISLRAPSERDVLTDQAAAALWVREWDALLLPPGVTVAWAERRWTRLGRQRLPVRVRFESPDAVATFVGGEPSRTWWRMRDRAAALRAAFGDTPAVAAAVRRHAEALRSFDDARFATVAEVAAWLAANPLAEMRPRQLPIRGVDSKWFGAHRTLVTDLHAAASRAPLRIVDADHVVRLRVLDSALEIGGLSDLAAPIAQLERLDYRPAAVFILENLESVLAMPEWPGAIVVHGSGYAVDHIGRLPWVQRAPVLYWGDLDTHGFAILHQLRRTHPDVTSVLMDVDTLVAQHDLWVPEPKPARATFSSLTPGELEALDRLRAEGDVRLEQERIPWATALAALGDAWREATGRAP